jgi:hypothetical protein
MLNEKPRLSKRKTRFSLEDVVFSNVVDWDLCLMRDQDLFGLSLL